MASTTVDHDEGIAEKDPQIPNAPNNDSMGAGENTNEQGQKKKKNRSAKDQARNTLRSVMHHDMRQFEDAEQNNVAFQSFSLVEALSENQPAALPMVGESPWIIWDDEVSRVALDRDNIPVLYHFPKYVIEPSLGEYSSACDKATQEDVALSLGNYDKQSYVFADGEMSGQLDFPTAVARENNRPTISQGLCEGFEPLLEFMEETKFLSQRINNLVELIDPIFYEGLKKMRLVINKISSVRSVTAVDPLDMEGRSLTFNQRTPLHANLEDFPMGWRVLLSLGSFTEGGYLRIPRLGLRMRFLPGDALVLRGAVLEHEVEAWSGGRKICLEHYTQDSIWKYANVEL